MLLLRRRTNPGTFHPRTTCYIRKVKVLVAQVVVNWIFLLLAAKNILTEPPAFTDISARMRLRTRIFLGGSTVPLARWDCPSGPQPFSGQETDYIRRSLLIRLLLLDLSRERSHTVFDSQ